MRPGRKRAVRQGILRTIPFAAAAILSLLLFYAGVNEGDLTRELLIFLIFGLLCVTVFFGMLSKIPYRVDDVIHDILRSAGYTLGGPYRVNIMVLEGEKEHQYFSITHSFRMSDPSGFRQKLRGNIEGAGTAYFENTVVYITGDKIDHKIDPYPEHIWSAPINGSVRAVLNIDCNVKVLKAAQVAEVKGNIGFIARLVEGYWELRDE